MHISPRARVLLVAAFLFAGIGALVWYLNAKYGTRPVTPIALPAPGGASDGAANTPSLPTPTPVPDAEATAATPAAESAPTPANATPTAQTPPDGTASAAPSITPSAPASSTTRLLIPVAGVRPEQLQDTFTDARSEGRSHDAIDIIAPRGTPVLATIDGRVLRLFSSVKGGITLYQLGPDERTVYYYAHLDRYADGIIEGLVLRRGETIGYVGDTGNATPGNYHLHFQVYRITDPKRFW
ncbi:MAG: peptidoglycan DD-metalloendopeptidase family protein, partial [Acidobacteria bacterium]|nr:peptidoglycan DD-metalloendopeptidase family protein [Acidobacteriota bacterium]